MREVNNRTRTIVIAFILGYMAYRYWPAPETPGPPSSLIARSEHSKPNAPTALAKIPPATPPPKITVKAATAPLKTLPAPTAISKPSAEASPHKPPPGSVPFTLNNGWVVAYGDILLGKPKNPDFPATGFIEAPHLNMWPRGIIPFSIHESLPNPERVLRVINYMNENTPVRFVAYSGQPDSIVFFPMDGVCVSYLGKIGGNQPIYLDSRCSDHEITHELMHALGFIHEHSRADRDQYVSVIWNNIEPDKQDQFDVTPESINDPMRGRPFDYNSVMLYPTTAFAREPGATTLVSRSPTQPIAPVSNGMSAEDLERLRILYSGR